MAKNLEDMFPDMLGQATNKSQPGTAARMLKSLTDTQLKDTQIALRINSNTYAQLKTIAAKRGMRASAIITMLISDYIRENRYLLDE